MMRVIKTGLPLTLLSVAACVLAMPSAALASNHEIKIREVYAGSSTLPNDEYVELQLYASGQNFLSGTTSLIRYDASGTVTDTFVPSTNPPNGQSQRRILFASASAQSTFGVSAGYTLAAGDKLSDAGGAVCYVSSTASFRDCVSWGNFNNTSGTPLPSAAGDNVDPLGIPDGSDSVDPQAIRRSIGRGCSSLLEAGDDTNAPADWSDVVPDPLNNAATPPETPCANTSITKSPKAKTHDRTPTFKFTSSVNPATFECALDGGQFKTCDSPFTTKKLKLGKHTFKVRATAAGVTDQTPASASFKVTKKPHH